MVSVLLHLPCCRLPDRSRGAYGRPSLQGRSSLGGNTLYFDRQWLFLYVRIWSEWSGPPILDRLGTLFLNTTGLVRYFTRLTHATAHSPRPSTHSLTRPTLTHCHYCTHTYATFKILGSPMSPPYLRCGNGNLDTQIFHIFFNYVLFQQTKILFQTSFAICPQGVLYPPASPPVNFRDVTICPF